MAIDEFKAANAKYVAQFKKGSLPMPPGRKVTVVTCMDARIDPARALGLEEGDAHVIRNAGGLAKEALRSIIISEQLLGTQELVLLHHTDCGMLTFTQQAAEEVVKKQTGHSAHHIHFGPFPDLEQSVKDDLKFLKNEPLIPDTIKIWGGIYKVETGEIVEVAE